MIFYYCAWNSPNGTFLNNAIQGYSDPLPSTITITTDNSSNHPVLCHQDFIFDSTTSTCNYPQLVAAYDWNSNFKSAQQTNGIQSIYDKARDNINRSNSFSIVIGFWYLNKYTTTSSSYFYIDISNTNPLKIIINNNTNALSFNFYNWILIFEGFLYMELNFGANVNNYSNSDLNYLNYLRRTDWNYYKFIFYFDSQKFCTTMFDINNNMYFRQKSTRTVTIKDSSFLTSDYQITIMNAGTLLRNFGMFISDDIMTSNHSDLE